MTSHPIPAAALSQHIAILGKTGSGKTSTAKLAVEQVVAGGARVCVLDPIKSDWWGLISSADGKHPGLPFHILGGPRGHVQLHASAGKAIGELVATGGLPLSIIDMALFDPGGQAQFFNDFAPALLRRMRGVVYLVIEEAHLLAPKERSGVGAENMSIHWAKMLATAGRSKGLRLVLVTQRTQALHNALLGSCDTMIAHRLTAPADQGPVIQWLKANVDKETREKVAGSLASLRTGSGWICSGEAGVFDLVQFPKISTYDNTTTPTGDGDDHEVMTTPVDQDRLRAIIGDAVKEAEASDPKLLRAEIVTLRRQMQEAAAAASRAGNAPDPAAIADAEARGIETGKTLALQALGKFAADLADSVGRAATACDEAKTACDDAQRLLDSYATFIQTQADAAPAPRPVARPAPQPVRQIEPKRQPAARANGDSSLSGPQRTFLQALAWWRAMGHDRPTRVQVASIAGWRVTSGHLKNVAGSLRTQGLIDYPGEGCISLTAAGAAAAPEPDTSASLEDSVVSILSGPQRQAFAALPKRGAAITREDLASRCGWEITSGHVKNVLGSMRSLEIIEYPAQGSVARAEWLRQ